MVGMATRAINNHISGTGIKFMQYSIFYYFVKKLFYKKNWQFRGLF